MADCQGRLRILAQAFEMYATDNNGFYPVADSWRYAISEYIDLVGVQTSDGETVRRTAKPRGFSSPMRCLGNHSVVPISYFYLSPDDFQAAGGEDAPGTPMLVDEVNHPKVMVLSCDSSCRRVDPMTWIAERDGPLQIARRPDWRKTFAYMSTRPVVPQQLRPPDVSVYVAPWQAASPPPPESR